MKGSDIKPGDKVELAHKGTSFYDPETELRLSIEGQTKLGNKIGVKTRTALLSGQLLIVGGAKEKAPDQAQQVKTAAPAKKAASTEEK